MQINNGGPVGVYATTDAAGTSWNNGVTVTVNDANGQPASVDDVQLSVTTDKVLLANANCIIAVDKAMVLAGGGCTVSPPASCVQNTRGQIWDVHNGFPEPSTAYYCNMYDGTLDWLSVDGSGTSIMVHEHTVPIPGFKLFPVSPGVPQPGGGTLRASGSNGMWPKNDLWCSGPSQCGGASCQHMFHVRTDTGMLVNDFYFSYQGAYVWSGSPGIDSSGNMWSLLAATSTTLFPSLVVGGFSAAATVGSQDKVRGYRDCRRGGSRELNKRAAGALISEVSVVPVDLG